MLTNVVVTISAVMRKKILRANSGTRPGNARGRANVPAPLRGTAEDCWELA
jgi:hypothetical protein